MRPPAPVAALPAWCEKVSADDIVARKKAKEAAKKAADKAKSADPKKAKPKVRAAGTAFGGCLLTLVGAVAVPQCGL